MATRNDFKGAFLGFKFNGIHSSELGIVRINTGDRAELALSPNFKDNTIEVPGSDGLFYFNTKIQQYQYNLNFAYEKLSEKDIRDLRQAFEVTKIGELIFDENPFKAYTVKVSTPPKLSYMVFGEDGSRIYNGEGALTFTAFYPYAHSVHKFLDEYESEWTLKQISEWSGASGMKLTQGTYDGLENGNGILLFNPGDIEADFIAYYSLPTSLASIQIIDNPLCKLLLNPITAIGEDSYIGINTKLRLIIGGTMSGTTFTSSGNIYNKNIGAGDFFKIPLDNSTFKSSGANCVSFRYNYLYY